LVALLEPFIDTVIICTITALVIIFSGVYHESAADGAVLTSQAFASQISWFPYVLTVVVFLFAFSTMISWSYYGLKAWNFLFGYQKWVGNIFKIIFLLSIVLGTTTELKTVMEFSDMMILAMAFPNLIGLILLLKDVKLELKRYFSFIEQNKR
jgi:AGCS family alanine or glycine:cation symporter